MTAQENISLLFKKIRDTPALKDKEKSKIFMSNDLATKLEDEMGIRDIKASGIGGYRVVIGPFLVLTCFNQSENVSIEIEDSTNPNP